MAICNKTTTTNIVNDIIREETRETRDTEDMDNNECKKNKCNNYRSYKPNTTDLLEENLSKITNISNDKNIKECTNSVKQKEGLKTVENNENIVEGLDNIEEKKNNTLSAVDSVRNILLLIISGLISVFVFALFIFGPFVFWSMHAPNKMYSEGDNKCYNGFTILERFFPFKKDSVPYNWEKAKENNWCYPKREKQASISIDTCMDNKISISGTGKVYDMFTYLESLLKGFPYNLIMPDRDQYYSKYVGGFLLFITLLISTYIFFMIYVFKGNFWRGDAGLTTMAVLIGMLLTGILSVGITFLTIKFHMKDKDGDKDIDIDMPWKHLLALSSIPVIGNLIGGFEYDGNNLGVITAIIAAVLVFMIFSSISGINNFKKPRKDEKDFTFAKLPGKMLHFIRKCIVNGYIENIKCYRKTFYSGFDIISNFFNNHLPKPIFAILFVFFGSFIIPIVLAFIYIIATLRSLWCGSLGMFKRNSSNSKKQESSNSGNEQGINNASIGGGKILSKLNKKYLM